jgi:hypothetical protein
MGDESNFARILSQSEQFEQNDRQKNDPNLKKKKHIVKDPSLSAAARLQQHASGQDDTDSPNGLGA